MFIKRATICLAAATMLWAGSVPGAMADVVSVNGHNAYTDRVLARVKKAEAGNLRALSLPQSDSVKTFDSIPGLLLLKRNAGLRAAAVQTAEQKAAEYLEWIAELKATGQFDYVEPDYEVRTSLTPTDRRFADGTLWGLHNYGQFGGIAGADLGVTNAWDLTVGSTNVVVAVIDSGVRYTHQDLAAQMWVNPGEIPGNGADDDNDGYIDNVYGIDALNNDGDPMDDDDHGTHVAGTIGAAANDGNEHVGVAWRVRIMALKFLGADGSGPTSAAIECINFGTRHRVRIMNNSWGGGAFSQALFDSILAARDAGIVFIAAAGNDANDNDRFPAYPASYRIDNIVSVAALDRADRLANFSNFGRNSVHVGAPGVAIWSTLSRSDTAYGPLDGTSMAAPHVTGVAALTAAYLPAAGYAEIVSRITNSVVRIPALLQRLTTGGRVSAFRALTRGADGSIEVSLNPAADSLVTVGADVVIDALVSDGLPITNATVRASTSYSTGTNLIFIYVPPNTNGIPQEGTYRAVYHVPDEPGTINFALTATAPGKTNFAQQFSYTAVRRPANDSFTNAVKVPAFGSRFEQSMDFASREDLAGEPLHGDTQGTVGGSVWYSWSLPVVNGSTNVPVLIDTAGSVFDTIIAVYAGNTVSSGGLQLIAATNDVGNLRQAWLKFNAQAGVSYKIAFAVGDDLPRPGLLKVRFEIDGEPDTRSPFIQIVSPLSGSIVRTNRIMVSGTSFDPLPNASGVADVQILVNNREQVKAEGTTNWVSPFPLLLDPGLNIIRVFAFDEARNQSAVARINVTLQEDATLSDLFARAIELGSGPTPRIISNANATKEFGEPNHAGNLGGKSVWFYFRPAQDGVLFLGTAGSSFDTLLSVYSGTNVSRLTEVASNDDTPSGSKQSEVTFGVRAGEIYNIAVDGYDAASGMVYLNYSFSAIPVFSIRSLPAAGGRVSPSSGLFPANSTVSLQATANPGFEFAQFVNQTTGEVIPDNPMTFLVTRDVTVQPVFRAQEFAEDFEGSTFKLPFVARRWTLGNNPNGGGGRVAISQETRTSRNLTNTLSLVARTLAGIGRFDYGVSSEPNYDRLEFWVTYYTDNQPGRPTMLGRWSGEVPKSTFFFETRSGLMSMEWRYVKDQAISGGRDFAFIDNLDFDYADLLRSPVTVAADGNMMRVTASGVPGSSIVIEASPDLKTWVALPPAVVDADGNAVLLQPMASGNQFFRLK